MEMDGWMDGLQRIISTNRKREEKRHKEAEETEEEGIVVVFYLSACTATSLLSSFFVFFFFFSINGLCLFIIKISFFLMYTQLLSIPFFPCLHSFLSLSLSHSVKYSTFMMILMIKALDQYHDITFFCSTQKKKKKK